MDTIRDREILEKTKRSKVVKKEILLVGGSGFLGLNLIKSLENNKNYRITSVSRTRPKHLKKK